MKAAYKSPQVERVDLGRLSRQDRLRAKLLDQIPYAVAVFQDARVVYANSAAAAIFGYARSEELIGRDVMGPVPQHERERLAAWAAARQAGDPASPDHLVLELARADGNLFQVEAFATPIEHDGRPALQVVVQDMSDRTDALRASEHRYRSLVERLPMAVGIIQDLKLVFVNQTTAEMLGYNTVEELLAVDMFTHVEPSEIARIEAYLHQWTSGDPARPSHYTTQLRRRDGETFPVEVFAQTISFEGRPATQAVAIDLSERAAAEQSLWRSTELYRRLVELSPNAITVTDLEGNFLVTNQQAARMHGFETAEEMQAADLNAFDLIAEEDRERALANARRVLAGQEIRDEPFTMVRRDGSRFPAELSASVLVDAQGQPEFWIGVTRDVTRRRQATEALRASEEQYRALVDALPHGVGIIQDRRIALVNPAGARILGFDRPDQVVSREAELPLVSGERERVVGMLLKLLHGQTEGPVHYTTRAHRRDGSVFPVEVFASRIQHMGEPALQLFLMDISARVQAEQERLELQAQVQHAQKLESLGVLAGGIAHDFNNLLMAVLGNVGLAMMDLPAESPLRPYLASIETTAKRAAELTQQMLAYSGKGRFVIGPVRLEWLVSEMAHLLRSAISKSASLQTIFEPNLPAVRGDATQLRQVIMNLITNASEALADEPGIISLSIHGCELGPWEGTGPEPAEFLPAGRYLRIEVGDTGVGMDAQTLERIFDPFFTTKFTGRGLGLAAVQGIVRGHNGRIEVDSQPGQGTRCRIWLPANKPSDESTSAGRTVAPGGRSAAAGSPAAPALGPYTGTALLADDEEGVRTTAKAMLERIGFEVVAVEDGRRALDLLRARPDRFELAVIDLTMPQVGGQRFLIEARALRPDLPVILVSGYSQTQAFKGLGDTGGVAFLQKPFTPSQLTAKIGELIG